MHGKMQKEHSKIAYGDIVVSVMGRDTGTAYIVTGIFGNNTALVADGRLHRLCAPKKKNIRHLMVMDVPEELRSEAEKAAEAEFGADRRLKKLLGKAEMLLCIPSGEDTDAAE